VTMHRRPLGNGRTLAAIGGIVIVIGCVLPWWQVASDTGLPAVGGNGLEASGILVFLVGLLTLALVTLPYAVGDRPTSIDRPLMYGILAIVGWLALGWRVVQLLLADAFQFDEPAQVFTNGPGLWVAGLGLAILSRAVYQMVREPAYR
jgi:hypothetical protein